MDRDVDWRSWRRYFESRKERPPPSLEIADNYAEVPPSVARSLAIFQVGESGGGTVVQQAARSRLPGVDASYVEAVRLFVAEEHRHAHLLALCVRMLNGTLKRRHWSARWFVVARRLLGLRTKILVLLAAEVVGLCYYNLITSRLSDGKIRTYLQEIADDERAHLRFHCAFLHTQCAGFVGRVAFRTAWRVGMAVAGQLVLFEHRRALQDLGIPPATLKRAFSGYARLAERLVLQGGDAERAPARAAQSARATS